MGRWWLAFWVDDVDPSDHHRHVSGSDYPAEWLLPPPRAPRRQGLGSGHLRRGASAAGADLPADREPAGPAASGPDREDRKSTRLNSSHVAISYAVFCLKKKNILIRMQFQ